ncbi:MAG: 50S ribosomal protein L18 [Blastocatellia bacterium AA13]|nr:MAG: 50S ribosomal protein L18 [Blastocatellia bacterium AA13]
MATKTRSEVRNAVHSRIRAKIKGSPERPRLAVFRSVKHIYVQVIDDSRGVTLISASTTEPTFKGRDGGNAATAKEIGKLIAERAKEKGITQVVFDRGGYIYHGRIRNLAEAAREAGLSF